MNKYLVCCGIMMLAINSIDMSYAREAQKSRPYFLSKDSRKGIYNKDKLGTSSQEAELVRQVKKLMHGMEPTIDNFISFLNAVKKRKMLLSTSAVHCIKIWHGNSGGDEFLKQLAAQENIQKILKETGVKVDKTDSQIHFSYTRVSVGPHKEESKSVEPQNSDSETNKDDNKQNGSGEANKNNMEKINPAIKNIDQNILENFNKVMEELKTLRNQVKGLQETVDSNLKCDISDRSNFINNYDNSTINNITESTNASTPENTSHISETKSEASTLALGKHQSSSPALESSNNKTDANGNNTAADKQQSNLPALESSSNKLDANGNNATAGKQQSNLPALESSSNKLDANGNNATAGKQQSNLPILESSSNKLDANGEELKTNSQLSSALSSESKKINYKQISESEAKAIGEKALSDKEIKNILIKKYPIVFGELDGKLKPKQFFPKGRDKSLDYNKILEIILSNSYIKEYCPDVISGGDKPIYKLELPDDSILEPYLKRVYPELLKDGKFENFIKERRKYRKEQLHDEPQKLYYELCKILGYMESAKNEEYRRNIELAKMRVAKKDVGEIAKKEGFAKNAEYKKHISSIRNKVRK